MAPGFLRQGVCGAWVGGHGLAHASQRSATTEVYPWEGNSFVLLFGFCSGLFGGHTSLAIVNDLSNYLMNYDYITVPINWMVGGQFSREMPSEGLSPQLIAALTKGHIGDEQVVIESHLASYPQAWCSR